MAASLPPVCILAGGLGSRLGEVARSIPKPLVEVAGEPFLVHQLRMLSGQGVGAAVLCVGHLGERIEARIGGSCEGVSVEYSYDGPGLDGTLGAIRRAAGRLGPEFLVLYGDTYLRVEVAAFHSAWRDSGRPAGMTVLRNEGRWDRSNVVFGGDRVLVYDKLESRPGMHWIDYGLGALTPDALAAVPPTESDLSVLYSVLARDGGMFGFEVADRFYEIGTPGALAETEAFLSAASRSRSAPAEQPP